MIESNYPATDIHKKQHSDFLGEVRKLQESLDSITDYTEINVLVNKAVVRWLTQHVLGSDMELAEHYRKSLVATGINQQLP
jgi:hemerythrin